MLLLPINEVCMRTALRLHYLFFEFQNQQPHCYTDAKRNKKNTDSIRSVLVSIRKKIKHRAKITSAAVE
jgi:hypothetical protein